MTLNKLLFSNNHIITQVVETKFVVGSIGNICLISFPSFIRIRIIKINTINSQSMEIKDWLIPLGIPCGQVIVYSYDVNSSSGQCIEVCRKNSCQGFTFTRLHFCDAAFMHCNSTNELNIIGDHLPFSFCASHFP